MPLTDEQRGHLERRLREERAQIARILDRYQDEQSAPERERAGDISTFPTHRRARGPTPTTQRSRGRSQRGLRRSCTRSTPRSSGYIATPHGSGCASERVSPFRSRGSTSSRGRGPAIRSGAPADSPGEDFPRMHSSGRGWKPARAGDWRSAAGPQLLCQPARRCICQLGPRWRLRARRHPCGRDRSRRQWMSSQHIDDGPGRGVRPRRARHQP